MKQRKSMRIQQQMQAKIIQPLSKVAQTTKRDRRLWPLVSLLPLLLILAGLWRIIRQPLEQDFLEAKKLRTPDDYDDLEKIEGIGPIAAGVLRQAGINTFSHLANTKLERLEGILHRAKLRTADPETWPEQARLAASGNWDGLAALQQELLRGRRTG
jgi:hypothetical protein